MRAIRVEEFGGPEVLEEVRLPDPVPAAGQAVVDVGFASVTFLDTQLRAGRPPRAAMTPKLPMVPGTGVGGVVGALGAGTDPTLRGRRVVAALPGRGGYAERAVVDASGLVAVPDALGLDVATALLADGRTARALLETLRAVVPLPGRTVLVAPAAGGVGSLLVSLLARDGARVVAAAGGPVKLDVARARGAALGVDYRDEGWPTTLHSQVGQVDVLLDGVGGGIGDAAVALVRQDGIVARFGAAGGRPGAAPSDLGRPDLRTIGLGTLDAAREARLVAEALADAAGGGVRPELGRTWPLARAADAHRAIEGRATIGKTLLAV
ncbi:zinc-binding dehydrogenase [Actinomycetospora sp. TBRC 11914]|uniref:zinc-binding dehydrogenase n=1 Tax=Actinomycetospora sp. TBRC 11914 TaxID=2729387 RepID=UPI00145F9D6A|nr:zinc-binding dehydrogenase [Actinomycetospora sp. TBRC 11914]NMO91552.1 zinc-binding dehydrogenase [Actinomycetospora sp. TBRC 11914]